MSKKDRVYQQSSVVPWLKEDDEVSVVLITSQSGNWIVPKGLVEPEMTPIESAAKEALEEAGVLGNAEPVLLSTYDYNKWGGVCHVKVFPLAVSTLLEDWDEKDWRERQIVPLSEAAQMVKPVLQPVLEDFRRWVGEQARSA